MGFEDRLQGAITQNLDHVSGDFVVQRADGLFAYQLAAVVDDAALGITHVVRGADLLDCTLRQVYLQQLQQTMLQALTYLQHTPPALMRATIKELLEWSINNWNPAHLPRLADARTD